MALTAEERTVLDRAAALRSGQEALLSDLVSLPSFTGDRDDVNVLGRRMEERLEALGFRTSLVIPTGFGGHVVARKTSGKGHRLLVLGHLDTVFPRGEKPPALTGGEDPDRRLGPGAADMKGGLVVLLTAFQALEQAGELRDRTATVILTADEEAGSPTSADFVAAEAADHDLCLVLEPGFARPDGATTFVTARKGGGRIRLETRGIAAHAGVNPADGVSAVRELAHKVVELERLTEPARGRTVTVGVFRGGTTANTIPAEASIEIDYRFVDEADGRALEDAIFAIGARVFVQGPTPHQSPVTRMTSHVRRPPMVRTEAHARMAARIVAAGADLGLALVEESRGGGSDGNFVAAAGCPTIDGLGAVGGGVHTAGEWASVRSLDDRARLLALTIMRFHRL